VARLAREDWRALEELRRLGVTVFARTTPASTLLRLVYPAANLDERTIELVGSTGRFTLDSVSGSRFVRLTVREVAGSRAPLHREVCIADGLGGIERPELREREPATDQRRDRTRLGHIAHQHGPDDPVS